MPFSSFFINICFMCDAYRDLHHLDIKKIASILADRGKDLCGYYPLFFYHLFVQQSSLQGHQNPGT